MKEYKVGVVGATGMVGQRFVSLLENHADFDTFPYFYTTDFDTFSDESRIITWETNAIRASFRKRA